MGFANVAADFNSSIRVYFVDPLFPLLILFTLSLHLPHLLYFAHTLHPIAMLILISSGFNWDECCGVKKMRWNWAVASSVDSILI